VISLIVYYFFIVIIGISSGFLAGLLGVGGGILIIPSLFLLYSFYPHPHSEFLSQCIFGTSNGIILINSIKNFSNYYKQGLITIKNTLKFACAGLAGGFIGARVASYLSSNSLKIFFGIFLLLMSIKMGFFTKKDNNNNFKLSDFHINIFILLIIGFTVGFVSGFFGIGGGIVAVPVLTSFCKIPMIFAQGFSVSLIPFNKIGGVLGFVFGGIKDIGISFPFIGFMDVSLVVICGILGGISTKWGLKIAKNLNQRMLQRIFALVLAVVAVKIIW
jgi:uncharacterized membrane protein YfcA